MQKRKLGNSGLEVSPLAFGGNVFGWSVDEKTAFTLLDGFVGAGFNFIDTADVYSRWAPGNKGGESETIIGNWLKASGKRDQVVIATKVGMDLGDGEKGLSKAYILRAVEASLTRLQTDRIDLYQSHTDDVSVPLEETLEAYDLLIRQGKVRAIGASNYGGERLAQARMVSRERGMPAYECLQPQYNLYDRADFENSLEPVVLEQNIGVITYYSLANGFLSGKYRSAKDTSKSSARGGRVMRYINDRGIRILDALDKIALGCHATPAAVALAWLMARKSVTAAIASATNLKQLDELAASTAITLDETAVRLLDEASAYDKAKAA